MSIVPKETIEVIAQSVGINNLSLDGALTLAPDVEYRMRELMQVSRCDFTWIGYFCLQCCHFRFLRRACFSVFSRLSTGSYQMYASFKENYFDNR